MYQPIIVGDNRICWKLAHVVNFVNTEYIAFVQFQKMLPCCDNTSVFHMLFKVSVQRMVQQKRTKISGENLRNRCSSTQAKPLLPGGFVSYQIASMKCRRHSRLFSLNQWWRLLNFQKSLLWRSWTLMMVSNDFPLSDLIYNIAPSRITGTVRPLPLLLLSTKDIWV